MRIGLNGQEVDEIVGALKKGKTFEEATARFRNVDPQWWKVNTDSLLRLAGVVLPEATPAEEPEAEPELEDQAPRRRKRSQ